MQVIYLDILFLCNLTFDILSVYITSHFTNTRLYPFRCLLACVLGSIGSIWLLIWCESGVLFLAVAASMLALMCCFSFSFQGIRNFLRLSMILLFCLFLTGAIAYYLLWFAVERWGIYDNTGNDGKALLFSAISIVSGAILSLSAKAVKRQNLMKTIKAKIQWDDRAVECTCLVDSGNLLKDPIDGKPVLLIPKNIGKSLFTASELFFAMTDKNGSGIAKISDEAILNRTRIVPYHTINQVGVLLCILPYKLIIDGVEKKGLIGICPIEHQEAYGICPQSLLG